jgi:hypothetical protein
VQVEGLNDSKNIGLCIYNVVVLSVLAVTMGFAVEYQVELSYTLLSGFILAATTLTQCIIFVPKVSLGCFSQTKVLNFSGTYEGQFHQSGKGVGAK